MAYDFPTEVAILEICARVRDYCDQTSPQEIQDRSTGKPMQDLSEPNEYAIGVTWFLQFMELYARSGHFWLWTLSTI